MDLLLWIGKLGFRIKLSKEKIKMNVNRRKVLLINPKFQIEILSYFTILNLIILCIIYIINMYSLYQAGSSMDSGVDPSQFLNYLRIHQQKFNAIYFGGAVVTTIMCYVLGFGISNRIAGPIYKIQKTIDEIIANGTSQKISVRDKDYFPELADKINELIAYYESKK